MMASRSFSSFVRAGFAARSSRALRITSMRVLSPAGEVYGLSLSPTATASAIRSNSG